MATSKIMLAEWQNPPSGPMPYVGWLAKRKTKAISSCGIAASHHKGKTKQNEILRHLTAADLPLDPGKVLSELKRLNILYAGANSRQKMAYVLLRSITPAGWCLHPNP